MRREKLQKHVFGTYFDLRQGLAIIGFVFPIVVIATAYFIDDHVPIQGSLSAYYWASVDGFNASRIPFVGGLFAVGAALYLYRGYTTEENWVLNATALCAVMVAVFPMRWTCEECPSGWTPHGTFAVGLFICLAAVAWRRAGDTLTLLPTGISRESFRLAYRASAATMALSPIIAAGLNLSLGQSWFVLLTEWIGIWAFSFFWAVKTHELRLSSATSKLLGLRPVTGPDATLLPLAAEPHGVVSS